MEPTETIKRTPHASAKKPLGALEITISIFSFILLGAVATGLGGLYFGIVNKYFPENLPFSPSTVYYSISSLIVALPLYVWAMRFWFRNFKGAAQRTESRLTKWLTYVVLLIASVTIVGDLIMLIFNFLQGESSMRFFLKSIVVLTVAIIIFSFYYLERKLIQFKKKVNQRKFSSIAIVTTALAILGIVLGFLAAGSPAQARARQMDLQRTNDLQQIASAISNFAFDSNRLPMNLEEVISNSRYNFGLQTNDPVTKVEYEYLVQGTSTLAKDTLQYELCANFSTDNTAEQPAPYQTFPMWFAHMIGRNCKTQSVVIKLPLEAPAPTSTPAKKR
jgi:type II secretory pathway pseudopilin PulG